MVERVLGHLAAHGIDEAVLSLGYRPDAFIDAYPDGIIAGVRSDLRRRAEPARHRRRHPVRRRVRRHRRDLRGRSTATCSPTSTSAAWWTSTGSRGAEGTIGLTPVDDPSGFGVVPTDDDGQVDGVHREAAPRRGPDQSHQRRDLRLRALGAGPHRRRTSGCRSNARRSRPWWRDGTLYALGSDAYWLDTGTPDAYLRAHRDLLLGRRGGPPAPGAVARPRPRPRRVAHRRGRGVPGSVGPLAPRPGLVGRPRRHGRRSR